MIGEACDLYVSNGISDFCRFCGKSAKDHRTKETGSLSQRESLLDLMSFTWPDNEELR